jgi:hypothetical protein
LDASMGVIVDEITSRVLAALNSRKSATPESAPARPEQATPAAPPPPASLSPSRVEAVRRISPLKARATSILGLELSPDSESPVSERRPLRSEGLRPAGVDRPMASSPLNAIPARFARLSSDSRFPAATAKSATTVVRPAFVQPPSSSDTPETESPASTPEPPAPDSERLD